ncbi:hypothetical protein VSU19_11955 [Verrucomicrobiales bacterium BCK34]|nr:hypothetical protein [Verrucomicrobiales bacterium BCK34]
MKRFVELQLREFNLGVTRFLLSLFVVGASILVSCSPVGTVTPVAKETDASLQEVFQGQWKMGEGVFHVAFDDEGIGHFAWIEWKDEAFVTSRAKFNAISSEDDDEMGFISIQLEEEAEKGAYVLGAFKIIEPDSIVFWGANPFENYASLLDGGKLEGSIENPDTLSKMVVFADGEKLMREIDSFSQYFDLEEPVTMSRILP